MLGAEVHHLLDVYVNRNLINRSMKNRFTLDYHAFLKSIPRSSLKYDLENIFCWQFHCKRPFYYDELECTPPLLKSGPARMLSIPDERREDGVYFNKIESEKLKYGLEATRNLFMEFV